MSELKPRLCLFCLCILTLAVLFCGLRPAGAALARKDSVTPADACNPQPADDDITLPMPCDLHMVFKLVAVPARGFLWDMPVRPGLDDSANADRAFYDRRYNAALSGPFALDDLPAAWR